MLVGPTTDSADDLIRAALAAARDTRALYVARGSRHDVAGPFAAQFGQAPAVVVADLDVIAAAPPLLNAAGYADLLAKVPAGADWLAADAAGVEPVDAHAWATVQGQLRVSVADPAGVRRGDLDAVRRLTVGLM